MDLGVNIHAKDEKGETVLHAAARGPNKSIVKLFIDRGIDIAAKNNEGETALLIAAENKSEKIIKPFLDYGVDVLAKNEKGDSILHSVTRTRNEYLRSLLWEIVLNVRGLYTTSNIDLGKYLYEPDSWEIILDKLGLKEKAELELSANNYFKVIEELLVYGVDVNGTNNDRNSALDIALNKKTTPSVVQLLLDYLDNIGSPENLACSSNVSFDNKNESKESNALIQHQVKLLSEFDWNEFVRYLNSMSVKTAKSYGFYDEFSRSYDRIYKESGEEIMRLKDQMFEDSTISYYDFWTTKDLNQLAAYARNNNIVNELTSDGFKSSFPRYATSLYNTLRKGMWRKRMMDRVSIFFHAFTKEQGNESIPKLPKHCIDLILRRLSNRDLRVLISICNPRNGFDVEIDSLL